jgi:rhamnosyl/mannosyltransferase
MDASREPRLKVLHVFKTYLPDNFKGIERVIWSIAEATARKGVEASVLAVSPNPQPKPFRIANHLVYQAKRNVAVASTDISAEFVWKLRELSRETDVVHYHFPWPMMDAASLFADEGSASLVTYHSDVVKQQTLLKLYRPLMRRFLGDVGRIVATSPNYLATSPVLRDFADKTSVIPIGIERAASQPPAETVVRWRQQLGTGFFLFIGAPRYYKGLPFLIEAARMAPGARVVLVGVEAKDLAGDGGIPPNVTALGEVDDADKEALLDLAQAFVLPSHLRSEAFGVVLAEAARASLPMITCEIGTGTTYVNRHNETGLVVPPEDPTALAHAMGELSGTQLAEPFGRNARRRFEELFTDERMADLYIEEYRQLLAAR